jgi:exodeoxyribonuclease VIII
MILEPNDFGNEYAVSPAGVDKRTKDGKAIWEAFMAENEGKEIVPADKAEAMAGMEAALEACPLAHYLIRGDGQTEVPVFWTDPETGEKCKAKCDRVLKDQDGKFYIVDYKTTSHADTEHFNRSIFDFGYHFQAGFYTEGLMTALDLDYRPMFVFVAQEKEAPYAVNVIEVSDDVMKVGVAKFHELLEKYHECKLLDVWDGYVQDVPNETQLPRWMSLEDSEE